MKILPFSENNDLEKRLKREAEEETGSNDQKKIKLDPEDIMEDLTVKNNLEENSRLNPIKTLIKKSESVSGSSCDSGSSTGSDSSDESVDMNRTDALNEIIKMKNKLIDEEISPEALKEIMEGRDKLFSNYFEGKTDITINRYVSTMLYLIEVVFFINCFIP